MAARLWKTSPQKLPCPSCGTPSLRQQQFCRICGVRLHTSRQVTSAPDRIVHPASLSRRFGARVIDYILLTVLFILANLLSGGLFYQGLEWMELGVDSLAVSQLSGMLLIWLMIGYFIVFPYFLGTTLGKWSLGVCVRTEGNTLNLGNLLVRELVLLFCLSLGGWPLLLALFHSKRTAPHEWLSSTQSVRLADS